MSLTIPLHITVRLGAPTTALGPSTTGDAAAASEAFHVDDDYGARPGYDPDFLGVAVPFPTLTDEAMDDAARDTTSRDADAHVLRYHHFSLVMSRSRRMLYVSACNTTRAPRCVGRLSRKQLQSPDRWVLDPRIDAAFQIQDRELYAGTDFDLGHVVQREDAYWSEDGDEEAAQLGNFDSFHYTNCTPQHADFNRNGGRWIKLEEHVSRALRAGEPKLCVLAGPVFRDDDRSFRGVKVPMSFWQVIAVVDEDKNLAVYGFVLSQRALVASMENESFTPAGFEAEQRSLDHLERITAVRFDASLHKADVLAATPNESVRVTSPESLRLRPAPPTS